MAKKKKRKLNGWDTHCPKCGVEDQMEVVAGVFDAIGMRLGEDGFSTSDAKQFNTADEVVKCGGCGKEFPLATVPYRFD